MSIKVKEAVKIAREYLCDLIAESVTDGWTEIKKSDFLLEEVEMLSGPQRWNITLSYPQSYPESPVIRRVFKSVEVLQGSGEVRAVKMRVFD